jgi:hypothetical protein
MFDEEFLIDAKAHVLMLDTPANQVQLPPPPPARESEAPAMWHPVDQLDDQTERIPLATEGDEDAANAFGIWLGVSALHAAILDARPERRRVPLDRLDVDEAEDEEEK